MSSNTQTQAAFAVQPFIALKSSSLRDRSFSVRASSAFELARRIRSIGSALDRQGGAISFIWWTCSATTPTHSAIVHYRIPNDLTWTLPRTGVQRQDTLNESIGG